MKFLASKNGPLLIGTALGALLVVLVGILVVFAVQVVTLSGRIDKRNDLLVEEVRNNSQQLDFLKQNLLLLAQDSNSVRGALKLPEQPYPVLEPQPAQDSSEQSTADLYASGLTTILRQRDREISQVKYEGVSQSPILAGAASRGGFTRVETGVDALALRRGERTYFTITVDPASQSVQVTDFLGKQLNVLELDDRFIQFVESRTPALAAHFSALDSAVALFTKAAANAGASSALSSHNLSLSPVIQTPVGYSFSVIRGGSPVLSVRLDEVTLAVSEGTKRYTRVEDFAAGFAHDLSLADFRTPLERKVDDSLAEIAALAKDRSFVTLVDSRHIKFVSVPRQDDDNFYFDFVDPDGKRIGSFAVQKKVGGIVLMDGQDVIISQLQTSSADESEDSKKKLTNPNPAAGTRTVFVDSSRPSFDVLIAGSHQGDTDTIMIAHGDSVSGRVVFISLPRDLYYKGRKINAIYHLFGPDELTREASEITGLHISKYMVIDMYAFVDVVNILGGIDLYLPSDLSDPTYRVRDNGVWSTLYYPKGWHHLDGIETLRVARSRHTTSDFARAVRQQLIIGAVREQLDRLGVLDAGKLTNLVQILMKYVETNFTPLELLTYFSQYKESPLLEKNVLDTDNVLYQTWSNIYYLRDKSLSMSADFDKGAWILLPKNDDWNSIRAYVQQIIQGA